jgi:uncharacterized protein YjbJ (UPF0337 family)
METTKTNKTEGTLREAAGTVQETIGSLVVDASAQIAGTAKELRGKARQLYSDAASLARDTMTTNPLGALAGAAAVGFLLGALWSFNRGDSDGYDTRRR